MLRNLLLLTLLSAAASLRAEPRQWTDVQSRKLDAEFQGMHADSVLLKLTNGQTITYPLNKLSPEDQAHIKTLQAGAPAPAATPTERLPVEKRVWPETVVVPTRSIEIRELPELAGDRKFVYRSEAFEFTSQAKLAGSVMKEVARTFEATKSLVNNLPWGIVCRPPEKMERFQAYLYETRSDYIQAGGPENSGGVYSTGDKFFRIPFPSLGLEKRGQTYFKNDSYSNETLVHEITHQMMDDFLIFLPMWTIEGTAEYTGMLPYKAGVFRADAHKNALKEYMDRASRQGLPMSLGKIDSHLTMRRETWATESASPVAQHTLYFRSLMLVYFFSHLDGDKKGTRFLKFLDAVNDEVTSYREFFKDPRVKQLGGGRFSYPSELKAPDMDSDTAPFKHLDILLDGRDYPAIAKEIQEGFKALGLKVSAS